MEIEIERRNVQQDENQGGNNGQGNEQLPIKVKEKINEINELLENINWYLKEDTQKITQLCADLTAMKIDYALSNEIVSEIDKILVDVNKEKPY